MSSTLVFTIVSPQQGRRYDSGVPARGLRTTGVDVRFGTDDTFHATGRQS